jgi:Protein of unknown function (DUF3326)
MIVNRTYEIPASAIAKPGGLLAAVAGCVAGEPLRWFVSAVASDCLRIESTECLPGSLPSGQVTDSSSAPSGLAVAISLIPTGIGCAIGGYAGDAGPATGLLASATDLLVTNPNAVNASNFISCDQRIVYTEGYMLDLFGSGKVSLRLPRANRIGVIIEHAPDAALAEVFNVINAVRAVHGVDIVDYEITTGPIGTRCTRHGSGAYVGQIDHPEVLLAAGERLLSAGATALAVTTNVQDLPADDYMSHFAGAHPNPVGGAEAVVSHLLTRVLQVPAAHAPMLNFKQFDVPGRVVDARSAGEFVSASGLACVLIGLRRAPQFAARSRGPVSASISLDDVIAVVAPATALGSVPVLSAVERGISVIAVKDNTSILDVTAAGLGLSGVIEVDGYLAAAGALLALRSGIGIENVRRPLSALGATRFVAAAAGVG